MKRIALAVLLLSSGACHHRAMVPEVDMDGRVVSFGVSGVDSVLVTWDVESELARIRVANGSEVPMGHYEVLPLDRSGAFEISIPERWENGGYVERAIIVRPLGGGHRPLKVEIDSDGRRSFRWLNESGSAFDAQSPCGSGEVREDARGALKITVTFQPPGNCG